MRAARDAAAASAEAVVAAAEREAAQQEVAATVPKAAVQLDKAHAAQDSKKRVPLYIPRSKDASGDKADEEEEGDDDEDNEESEEKEISWHVGQEEMGKVDLPKHWPLNGRHKVVSEAGGVAVARRLLKENQKEQAKLKTLSSDLEDVKGFEKRVDIRVNAVGSQVGSHALADSLGKMWKEMRRKQAPILLPFLEREEAQLKAEEPELQESLEGKADTFQNKWTRNIIKFRYPKDTAMLAKGGKVTPSVHSGAGPRSHSVVAAVVAGLALFLAPAVAI